MPKITFIALTGGPCAGKTSALEHVRKTFTDMGYRVLVVAETATELMLGGLTPRNAGGLNFQRTRQRLQLAKEEAYLDAARALPDEKVLVMCDRGMLDGLSYLSREDFDMLLRELGTSEAEQRDRYDAVFHLVTAARGAEETYTLENNSVRTEDLQGARALDDALIAAWTGTPHLRFIDNSTDFQGKLDRLAAEIASFLGEPEPLEIERKFLIEYPDLALLNSLPNCRRVEIEQAYLARTDGVTARVRSRGTDGVYAYFLTEKRHITDMKRVEVERRISREEYEALLAQADPRAQVIRKDRYCLSEDGKYFEIDVFPEWKDKAFLELELRDESEPMAFPREVKVIREVTEDPRYTNFALALSHMRVEGE